MPDFDRMTHEQMARHADQLRVASEGASDEQRARIAAELGELDAAARRKPQQITGSMG